MRAEIIEKQVFESGEMMKKSVLAVITFVLILFLRTGSACGQALENMERAEITRAARQSEFFREKESTVSESDGVPIAIGIEPDNVRLYQGSELIQLAQNLDEERARAETKKDDVPDETVEEWDPWESFNEKIFWFNRQVDHFILKPVAKVYNAALPGPIRSGIANMFDNLDVTRRLVNNILQFQLAGAGRELARFAVNSTVGIGGLFDVAGAGLGIAPSNRDTGQTLGVYGIGHGPYLVLPLLPPLTVRDFFGFAADQAMYPLNYFIPTGAIIGTSVAEEISDRAANIDRYDGVEETVVDLYGAVRNAYFQRRAADLKN